MNQYQIVQILLALKEKQEIPKLEKWLTSPRKHKNAVPVRLFQICISDEIQDLQPKDVWRLMGKTDDFSRNHFNQMCHELLSLLKEYLIDSETAKRSWLSERLMLDRILDLGLDKSFRTSFNSIQKKFAHLDIQEPEALFTKYEAELSMHRIKARKRDYDSTHLQQAITDLEDYFLAEYLQLMCLSQAFENARNQNFDHRLKGAILDSLSEQPPQQGLPYIYFELYSLLSGQKMEIGEMLEYVKTHRDSIAAQHLLQVYDLTSAYYIQILNAGAFDQVALPYIDLMRWGVETGILLTDGQLTPTHYRNMVVACLRASYTERALFFIENWKELLPKQARDDFYRYCMWYYAYKTRSYAQLSQYWSPVQPLHTPYLELSVRFLYLLVLYEQHWESGEIERVDDILRYYENLKRYLKSRKQLSRAVRLAHQNSLKLFKLLMETENKTQLTELLAQVNNTQYLLNREWFVRYLQQKLGV